MSKEIFYVFCVAVLFSSGLVWATPKGGDTVATGFNKIGGSLDQGFDNVAEVVGGNESVVGGIFDGLGDIVGGTFEVAGSLINNTAEIGEKEIPKAVVKVGTKAIAAVSDVAGAVGGVSNLVEAGSKAGAGAINKNYNTNSQPEQPIQPDQGNNQALKANSGKTVQIPTIFFMVLAIFNH